MISLLQRIKTGYKNEPSSLVNTFLNTGFFMVVQTLFFYYIASKQVDNIIISKVNVLNTYMKFDNDVKTKTCDYLKSDKYKTEIEQANFRESKRNKLNKILIFKELKYFYIGVAILIFAAIIFSVILKQKPFDLLTLAVLGAFTTELLFFFGMVQNYQFIGDLEIVNTLYNNIKKRYNNNLSK